MNNHNLSKEKTVLEDAIIFFSTGVRKKARYMYVRDHVAMWSVSRGNCLKAALQRNRGRAH